MSQKSPTYKDRQNDVRTMELLALEVVDNEYSDRDYEISLDITEFSCVCPKTGLPDYATFDIVYVPDETIVELKSLKLYLTGYRNIGIFHEHVINRISDDIIAACSPRALHIAGHFNTRGGIDTTVSRDYVKDEE